MNKSDLRHLMLPEDESPQERHARIKERVMAGIRTDEAVSRPSRTRSPRLRRRLVPVLVSLLILAGAGAAAGFAFGVFPTQTRSSLEELGCRYDSSVEQLVATVETAEGNTHQLWITTAAGNSRPNGYILIEVTADGRWLGTEIGCGPPSLVVNESDDEYYAGASSQSSEDGTLLIVSGHVPPEARTAIVTFNDGTETRIEVQDEGYFLGLVERPDIVTDGEGNVRTPHVVHLVAIDANGIVIAELDM